MQDIEQTIRERAYHLWLESGCQNGDADGHWLAAQREILNVALGVRAAAGDVPAKPKKAKVSRKRQRAA